jgi:hypothetical protein
VPIVKLQNLLLNIFELKAYNLSIYTFKQLASNLNYIELKTTLNITFEVFELNLPCNKLLICKLILK